MRNKLIILIKISPSVFMDIPPLGLLYVGGALQQAGYQVEILHISTEEVHKYSQEIIEKNPLYVGFSVFTGTAMRAYAQMCREIKGSSDIPVVWGNAHPSLLPRQCLLESYIDFVVIGEGEVTSVELAQAIEGEKSLSEVKGIGYKENGMIKINERRPFIQDLDNYAMNWDLVDIHRYIGPWGGLKRVLQFVTSRGCPHQCGFCYNLKFNQRRWRAHSVDFVVDQILQLKQRNDLKGVRFWDDNFFVNKTRAFEIIERIDMPYYAEARIDYVDESFARKLAETRCVYLLTGIESGSDRILKMINKNVSVSQIKESVKALAKYPLVRVSGSIIFAYPTETQNEFISTIRLIVDLLDIKSYMDFTTGFYMPYPGSDLYELALKEGFKPPARTEEWEDLDRWADKHEITWVEWISSSETAKIRKNIQLLCFLYRYNILFLKGLVRKRILVGNGHLYRLGMRLLVWLHSTFYSGNHSIFNFVRRSIVPIIWRIRRMCA